MHAINGEEGLHWGGRGNLVMPETFRLAQGGSVHSLSPASSTRGRWKFAKALPRMVETRLAYCTLYRVSQLLSQIRQKNGHGVLFMSVPCPERHTYSLSQLACK